MHTSKVQATSIFTKLVGISLFSLLTLFIPARSASAQAETGTVAGQVTDPTGAVIPQASISITNVATNAVRTANADSSGQYTFPAISAGIYELSAQGAGFQPYKSRFELTVGGRITVNARLAITGSEQTVTVVGEGGATVNTQTQEVSQVVSTQQVSQLPSLTRNPYDFITIAGNISSGDKVTSSGATSTTGDQNDTTRGVGFSLNGQRSTGTEILLDGVENNDTYVTGPALSSIPIDSVQEYRVITSNFGPEYGRASGGVVNIITKSGTNALHGSAWEFNRLSAYTANTVTNAQSGTAKGKYTRNVFGYAIGGPVVKDKLFFFQSTEWVRVRGAGANQSLIPTPEFLAASSPATQAYFAAYGKNPPAFTKTLSKGDITAGSGGVKPNTGKSFANLPDATPVFGVVNFSAPSNAGGGNPGNTYYLVGRGDYNLTDRTQMFGRYALYNEIDQAGGLYSSPYSQFNVGVALKGSTYLYSLTHEFSPTLVSNTKLSFTRNSTTDSFNAALQGTPTLYFKSTALFNGIQAQLPGFYDINEGTGGLPAGGPQNTAQINQDFDLTRGHHSLKFGTQLFYIQNNITYGAYAQAVEGLSSTLPGALDNFLDGRLAIFQAAVNPGGVFPCARDYVTGALLNTPSCQVQLPASKPSFSRSNRYKEWAVYAQDSYKVSSRLNLNYGLRYDALGVLADNHPNLQSNFFPGTGGSLAENYRNGKVLTTPNAPNHRPWNPQHGTFSPRVGFAYDLSGTGKTSIRGGFGISYERNFGNVTFNMIQNPPNYAVVVINPTTANPIVPVTTSNSGPLGGASGSVSLPPTSLRAIDPNIRVASTQFYSMTLEHQVVSNAVVSIGYIGSRGIHLYDIKNFNTQGAGNIYLGDSFDPTNTGDFHYSRLISQYSNINTRGSSGDSHYDGVNVGAQVSDLRHSGLSLTANYTFAHSMDDISSTFSESASASNGVGNLGYLDPFNPGLDYGASDFDVRQRFVLAPIYQTPWFRNSRSLVGRALGGYQVTGIYTVRTGAPFTISDSTNSLNAGAGHGIPRYAPSTPLNSKVFKKSTGQVAGVANVYNLALLPAAINYSNPAYGGISDFGPYPASMTHRNAFYGPGAWNFDASVTKSLPITERVSVELRAEGFNILNHHNLYSLNGNNDVGNYGYVDTTDPNNPIPTQIPIQAKKGGVNGGANDERRFGQFAAKITF